MRRSDGSRATVLESIRVLANGASTLARRCITGLEADQARCRALAEGNLTVATALNPVLGYTRVESIVREVARSGRTIRDVAIESGVAGEILDRYLDLDRIQRGNAPPMP